MSHRLSYFVVDAGLLLDMIINYPGHDVTLPKDAKLEWAELDWRFSEPLLGGPCRLRFVVNSETYGQLNKGELIPRVDVVLTKKA